MLESLFTYLVFPGFLFSACAGLFACWAERKVSARLQFRVGPPWYQGFMDIFKLCLKETILPQSARATFLLAPFFGLAAAVLAATILGRALLYPLQGFSGDIIVVLYLLTVPAVSLVVGASSSRNPLASVGASREMKLILAYELPLLLSVIAVIIKAQGALQLNRILAHQEFFAAHIASFSGGLAFAAAFFSIQAKLGMPPFEISEADQELMGGVLIEYSGLPLAVFKLTKAVLLYTLPVFLIVLFLGGGSGLFMLAAKFVAILVLIILVKNTNPRLRIDQALRFFWGPAAAAALLAVILASFGL